MCLFAVMAAGFLPVSCDKAPGLPAEEVNGMTMVLLPAGEFMMGSDEGGADEKPVHKVALSAFWIGRTEVTNAQYARFLNDVKPDDGQIEKYVYSDYSKLSKREDSWQVEAGFEDCPMVWVSWYGAEAYCKWAGGRLPTEAEWEYAAKGGRDCRYSGSNKLGEVGWFVENSGNEIHPVAKKKANGYGLYDMSGNVWEWCADRCDEAYYGVSPGKDPQGPAEGARRLFRGGSFADGSSVSRVSRRACNYPVNCSYELGFRVARSAE